MEKFMPEFKDDNDKLIMIAMFLSALIFMFISPLVVMLACKNVISETSYKIAKAFLNFELLLLIVSILFVIISGLAFGLIHVMGEPDLYTALIQSMPYVAMGLVFAFVYVRTNNITASMTVHATKNTFGTIIQLLTRL